MSHGPSTNYPDSTYSHQPGQFLSGVSDNSNLVQPTLHEGNPMGDELTSIASPDAGASSWTENTTEYPSMPVQEFQGFSENPSQALKTEAEEAPAEAQGYPSMSSAFHSASGLPASEEPNQRSAADLRLEYASNRSTATFRPVDYSVNRSLGWPSANPSVMRMDSQASQGSQTGGRIIAPPTGFAGSSSSNLRPASSRPLLSPVESARYVGHLPSFGVQLHQQPQHQHQKLQPLRYVTGNPLGTSLRQSPLATATVASTTNLSPQLPRLQTVQAQPVYETRPPIRVLGETHYLPDEIIENMVEVPEIQLVEKIVEVPEIKVVERLINVPKITTQERVIQVPKIQYQEVVREVPKFIYEERIVEVPQYEINEVIREIPRVVTHERIVEVPRPQVVEKLVEVPHFQTVERVVEVPQIQTVEKLVEIPHIITQERIVEVPHIITQERLVLIPQVQRRVHVNREVSVKEFHEIVREVSKVEIHEIERAVEVPEIQYVDRHVEVPQLETVERVVEVPQVQVVNRHVDVPKIQTVERVVEVPHVQVVDRHVDVPQIQEVIREVPKLILQEVVKEVPKVIVQEVQKKVDVPQLQVVDRLVSVPQLKEITREVLGPITYEDVYENSCLTPSPPARSQSQRLPLQPPSPGTPKAANSADTNGPISPSSGYYWGALSSDSLPSTLYASSRGYTTNRAVESPRL